jgi:hypothetical protein
MTLEPIPALLPALGAWMTAGLVSGWLFGLLSRASDGRR